MSITTPDVLRPITNKDRRTIALGLRDLANEILHDGVSDQLVLDADQLVDAFRREIREQQR